MVMTLKLWCWCEIFKEDSKEYIMALGRAWSTIVIYKNMHALAEPKIFFLTITHLVERSINMLWDHHDSRTDARMGVRRRGQGRRTQPSWSRDRVRDTLDHPPLLPCPCTLPLCQSAGIHQDVFTQGVGITCWKCHRNTGGEGHLVGELKRKEKPWGTCSVQSQNIPWLTSLCSQLNSEPKHLTVYYMLTLP